MNLNTNSLQFKSTGWLNTEKIYYDNSLIKPFSDYANELEAKLLQNICKNFSTNTFPIQSIILDSILPVLNFTLNVSKRNFTRRIGDILVNAATGSGKTLAYSIPIVQTLFKRQINLTEDFKGPSKKIALDADGNFSKAAQGFVRGKASSEPRWSGTNSSRFLSLITTPAA